jgi:hypothetical protein
MQWHSSARLRGASSPSASFHRRSYSAWRRGHLDTRKCTPLCHHCVRCVAMTTRKLPNRQARSPTVRRAPARFAAAYRCWTASSERTLGYVVVISRLKASSRVMQCTVPAMAGLMIPSQRGRVNKTMATPRRTAGHREGHDHRS